MIDFSTVNDEFSNYEDVYNGLLKAGIKVLNLKCDPSISVYICDNKFIHEINNQYRNIDKETDVISFAFLDNEDYSILKKPGEVILGDIYISYEKALSQAKEYGNSNEREFMFLFVHGMLHLCGYDHMKKEDEEIMFPLQEEIIKEYLKGK